MFVSCFSLASINSFKNFIYQAHPFLFVFSFSIFMEKIKDHPFLIEACGPHLAETQLSPRAGLSLAVQYFPALASLRVGPNVHSRTPCPVFFHCQLASWPCRAGSVSRPFPGPVGWQDGTRDASVGMAGGDVVNAWHPGLKAVWDCAAMLFPPSQCR